MRCCDENGRIAFSCDFAFMSIADCISYVTEGEGADARDIGRIGAALGGHVEAVMEDGRKEHLLIDVKDLWHSVRCLLQTDEAQRMLDEAVMLDEKKRKERQEIAAARREEYEKRVREKEAEKLKQELKELEAERLKLDEYIREAAEGSEGEEGESAGSSG
jgi:hypothetical protein